MINNGNVYSRLCHEEDFKKINFTKPWDDAVKDNTTMSLLCFVGMQNVLLSNTSDTLLELNLHHCKGSMYECWGNWRELNDFWGKVYLEFHVIQNVWDMSEYNQKPIKKIDNHLYSFNFKA